jgi:alpha-galactosidase
MSIANSWRISGDIYDSFDRPDDLCPCETASDPHCIAPGSHCSVLTIINKVAPYVDRGQPGGWNDLDMLEVGNGGMTDDEYKVHFSMWAAIKSPLLMGNDLRTISASTLTILNNPAVIAVNQDPYGRSVTRIRRDIEGVAKDKYGVGEIHVWSGPLYGGDQVVVLLNAGDEDAEISATLEEIFVADGPEGSAPQVRQAWEVHDLWRVRMSKEVGQKILDQPADVEEIFRDMHWYNSTEVSYKEGLMAGDERLFGKLVGRIAPNGALTATVPRHGVEMFRLRALERGGWRKYHFKTEL